MLRNIKAICVGGIVGLTMISCELEQEVLTGVTQERLLNEAPPELAEVLKQSAYSRLLNDGSWGSHGGFYSYQEISSDELSIPVKGGDWNDGGIWVRAHRHTWNIDDGGLNGIWDVPFRVIAETNSLIQQFPDVVELSAEMKVLRAFCYLVLLDNFGGGVPLVIETTTDANPPSSSREELFNFIETSVLENADLLTRDNRRSNFNYWNAHMILAKLYLNAEVYIGQPKWTEANAMLDFIINEGPYSLTPNYFANFSAANSNSSENMFTLPFDANNAPGFNIHHMTFHYESQKTFELVEQPWNGYAALEEFYNSYEDDDLRKNNFLVGLQFASDGVTVLRDDAGFDGDPDGVDINFTPNINQLEPNAFRQAGARVNKFEIPIGSQSNLNNDFPVFRYADALLMKAEVLLRQGNAAGALVLVNQVRQRAGVDPFTTLTMDSLLEERGRELFAEGWRRSDLIRFNRFGSPWWEKPNSPATRNVFPIPLSKIQGNVRLTQNPGY
ncbi:RagB/SusD family nutrient uptake outer membrane protein [Belliella sp. R4-6]|uniref:RagB/SusD family nutrient uptake outer membrane protein n=1 Tax=Belliella alkalica TaxID=1730871 RepID=A0ABS9V8H8_9BACT|nr:RagB/SusD family nutrient uptake outer membrane protein [Belliella alkalica]MCH7412731.1 RagB/SusD family nutrient uptake outer membrane protein [Belliella alkalica]